MPLFEDVVWTAGFLEGEGSFHIWKTKGHLRPRVKASQIDTEPLERLKTIWGGSVTIERRAGSDYQTRREINYWSLSNQRAANLMELVRPFMSARRREQIDQALAVDPGEARPGAMRFSNPYPATAAPRRSRAQSKANA